MSGSAPAPAFDLSVTPDTVCVDAAPQRLDTDALAARVQHCVFTHGLVCLRGALSPPDKVQQAGARVGGQWQAPPQPQEQEQHNRDTGPNRRSRQGAATRDTDDDDDDDATGARRRSGSARGQRGGRSRDALDHAQEQLAAAPAAYSAAAAASNVCDEALHAARRLSQAVRAALRRATVPYNQPQGGDWRYEEAAGRCCGRLDYRVAQETGAFQALDAALQTRLGPLLAALLGTAWRRAYGGVVEALPGAEAQDWHMDGDHLFEGLDCPPHALTVFVALCSVDAASGLGSPQVRGRGEGREGHQERGDYGE